MAAMRRPTFAESALYAVEVGKRDLTAAQKDIVLMAYALAGKERADALIMRIDRFNRDLLREVHRIESDRHVTTTKEGR